MGPASLDEANARFATVGVTFDVAKRNHFAGLVAQDLGTVMAQFHRKDVLEAFKQIPSPPDYRAFSGHSFGDSEETFNPIFHVLLDRVRPRIVIEVGTWFGTSAVIMASYMKSRGMSGKIICVDDFNAWPTCWGQSDFPKNSYGRALVYEAFLGRVVSRGLEEYVVPLPTTSAHAYWHFSEIGMQADLIYIDAAHDERSVSSDLLGYYACMREGGVLFGDDYTLHRYGYYPVKTAVDAFAAEWGLTVETHGEKWVIEARMPFVKA